MAAAVMDELMQCKHNHSAIAVVMLERLELAEFGALLSLIRFLRPCVEDIHLLKLVCMSWLSLVPPGLT